MKTIAMKGTGRIYPKSATPGITMKVSRHQYHRIGEFYDGNMHGHGALIFKNGEIF